MTKAEIENLLIDNKKLIYYTIKMVCPEYINDEDMFQIGYIALYNAIISYDKNNTASLHHYAIICIKRAIYNELKYRNRIKNRVWYLEDIINTKSEEFDEISNWEEIVEDKNYKEIDSKNTDIDIKTFLDKYITNNREKEFYKYKNLGYKDIEIAKLWGVSRQRVAQIKQRLFKKWTLYNNEIST